MPREARKRQEKGIHHVVVQGKRLGQIFKREEDKGLYWDTVLRYKEETGVQIYALCILENHAHLVLCESECVDVSGFMRRVGVSYAYWYRQRHPEIPSGGETFRGRYRSEPLCSEPQILDVVRYVHQEPVRSGAAEHMAEYWWSTYRLYMEKESWVDRRLVLDSLHFSGGYLDYMQEKPQGQFLEEVPMRYGRSDEEAAQMVRQKMEQRGIQELKKEDKDKIKNFLREMKYDEGVSAQQLSRVTGVNRGFIQRL